jgi:branched-chain amino acid transport system permease protein
VSYVFHLLIYLDIFLIVAISLNIVAGYCGLLTLAHASYFAIGAYCYAIASLRLGWEFLPSVLLGSVVAALLSLCISLPAWRFRGDFFVIVSLAVHALFFSLLYNWVDPQAPPGDWRSLTNGPLGLAGLPKPILLGHEVRSLSVVAFVASAVAACCFAVSAFLLRSPWGRLLLAMRDDELAARGLGKDVRRIKVQAFAIACGMAASAGVLYGCYVSYVDPTVASLDQSILMLSMVIVGGLGNVRGPVVGALVILLLPEGLRFVALPAAAAANLRLLIYGACLVAMMHLRPQGLAGRYRLE